LRRASVPRLRLQSRPADGSKQTFHVSGEPMFNQACRFVGYRGIGVGMAGKK
jgi:hypothetical protein